MRAAAMGLLLGLLACGRTQEEKRFDAFRDLCQGLVPGGATLDEAVQAFGATPDILDCTWGPQQPLAGGVDQCGYPAGNVCRAFWVSYAFQDSLCGPPGRGGCWFWCEVRLPGGTAPPPGSTVLCGSWFVSGQPYGP